MLWSFLQCSQIIMANIVTNMFILTCCIQWNHSFTTTLLLKQLTRNHLNKGQAFIHKLHGITKGESSEKKWPQKRYSLSISLSPSWWLPLQHTRTRTVEVQSNINRQQLTVDDTVGSWMSPMAMSSPSVGTDTLRRLFNCNNNHISL